MAQGDHIYVYCDTRGIVYTHHGIDCGDGTVIHFSRERGKVSRDTMSYFESLSSTKLVHERKYIQCYSPSVVVCRAMDRLDKGRYNLIFNNCEHFATWCKTGQHKSQQVDNVLDVLGKITDVAIETGSLVSYGANKHFRILKGLL
ncbi:MAG TPA: lecithin retinol acyltransferase family protein [Allocoleopsis sp.]